MDSKHTQLFCNQIRSCKGTVNKLKKDPFIINLLFFLPKIHLRAQGLSNVLSCKTSFNDPHDGRQHASPQNKASVRKTWNLVNRVWWQKILLFLKEIDFVLLHIFCGRSSLFSSPLWFGVVWSCLGVTGLPEMFVTLLASSSLASFRGSCRRYSGDVKFPCSLFSLFSTFLIYFYPSVPLFPLFF